VSLAGEHNSDWDLEEAAGAMREQFLGTLWFVVEEEMMSWQSGNAACWHYQLQV
jgi:hypothetical protein